MFRQDKDHLDQHFLIDEEIITRYIESINIKKSDTIVEIGAGKGVLTKIMAPLCKKLIVIELDKTLKPYLDKIENIEVIYNNVLDISIPKCNKIVTSLPYSIIEPFMQKLITTDFEELIMLMGSTYINHVLNKDITRLSIITNSYFKTEKIFDVEPSSFDIPPHTLSTIVRITKLSPSNLSRKYQVYHYLYYYQNMKIKNALQSTFIKLDNLTKREAKAKVVSLNIPDPILETKFEIISNENLKNLDKILSLV